MKYKFLIEKTKTGYSAYELNLPIFTVGKTIHDLRLNTLEAVSLHEEDQKKKTKRKKNMEHTLGASLQLFWLGNTQHQHISELTPNLSQTTNLKTATSIEQIFSCFLLLGK